MYKVRPVHHVAFVWRVSSEYSWACLLQWHASTCTVLFCSNAVRRHQGDRACGLPAQVGTAGWLSKTAHDVELLWFFMCITPWREEEVGLLSEFVLG